MTSGILAALSETLAVALLEPDADLTEGLGQLLDSNPGPSFADALARMHANRLGPESQAVEYARLFMHNPEGDVIHLYGSVHAKGHLMAPEVLLPLTEIYDAADISPQEDLTVPPDHLGLELACLGYLLEALDEADGEDRAQWSSLARRLLREHLDPLTRAVAEQLPQLKPAPYYLAAVDLARALVVEALQALD